VEHHDDQPWPREFWMKGAFFTFASKLVQI